MNRSQILCVIENKIKSLEKKLKSANKSKVAAINNQISLQKDAYNNICFYAWIKSTSDGMLNNFDSNWVNRKPEKRIFGKKREKIHNDSYSAKASDDILDLEIAPEEVDEIISDLGIDNET